MGLASARTEQVSEAATVATHTSGAGPRGRTGAVGVAVLVAALVIVQGLDPDGVPGELAFLTATCGAAAFAWLGVRRHRPDQRQAWVLVALGLSASGFADALSIALTHLQGSEPSVSVADPFWLVSYVLIGCGVIAAEVRSAGERMSVDTVLDVAAFATVSLLVVWQVSISSTLADPENPFGVRVVWASYPVLDAVLLALVLRTVVDPRARALPERLLAAGAGCWLVADLLYLTVAGTTVPWLLDAGWMLGAVLLAVAAWVRPSADPPGTRSSERDDGQAVARLALVALVPLLVPGLFEIWGWVEGKDVDPIPLYVATIVLAALAFLRAVRLVRSDRALRAELLSREHHYRALAANSSDAVVVLDADGRLLDDAPNLARLLGETEVVVASEPFAWVPDGDPDDIARSFTKVLVSPGAVVHHELRWVRPDGTTVWLESRAVNLLHDPDVHGIVVNLQDITARKQLEEDLAHQAFHDSLTGLANRALLLDRLGQVFRRRHREDRAAAVLYLDVDGFKAVNDGLGHDAGDTLLREVARRLEDSVRVGDTVARLGGDEFAVVTEESSRCLDEAQAIAERILGSLAAPMVVGGRSMGVTASIGIATTAAADAATEVLADADGAMYRAKAQGKGRVVVHEPEMRAAASERIRLQADLPGAAARGELLLQYQPVVELEDERLVGFEALVRWQHPDLGLLPPDRFVPLAEDQGSIVEIGAWVLDEACRTAAGWRERNPSVDLTMAVNVSGRQLVDREIVEIVRRALVDSSLPASALVLEMTETVLVEDASRTTGLLQELRELGVRLAIDDFGTGYSSLSYLRQFPVDILKIDRSFVSTITDGDGVPAIVHGLIDLGHALGLELVAEGIEQAAQRDGLRQEGCAHGQGFLFAHPLAAEDAEAWAQGHDRHGGPDPA